MSLLKHMILPLLLGWLLTACKTDLPSCLEGSSESLPIATFGQLDRPVTCFPKRIAEDIYYIINDQDHFEGLIHCNTHTYPRVDFKKYTLLLGSYLAPRTGYSVASQEIRNVCGVKKLIHKVTIQGSDDGSPALTPVAYYAVIPKTKKGISVEVKIEVKERGKT
jgi:hypothetical protein